MAHTNYAFYLDTFCGTLIPTEEEFSGFVERAEAYTEKITFGRCSGYGISVKMAVCSVCEMLFRLSGREGIESETNDGLSVRFVTDNAAKDRLLYRAASIYLPDDMLFLGVCE